MNIQIKFYLFIENLCFCRLKIAVCVPKIPIGRKKIKIPIRLKITEWAKNFGLKISGVLDSGIGLPAGFRTTTTTGTEDTNGTPPPEKGGFKQSGKFAYIIGVIAANEKKYKKS